MLCEIIGSKPRLTLCVEYGASWAHVEVIVVVVGSWITRPHVTRVRAQLVFDFASHKKKDRDC
jgi:hypothetical protein